MYFVVRPLQDAIVSNSRSSMLLLLGAVGFVILIACANLANLQLIRASGRKREFAIRSSLGASPGRSIRQLLTESVLLSLIGGLLGLGLGELAVRLLLTVSSGEIPRLGVNGSAVGLDWRVSTAGAHAGRNILSTRSRTRLGSCFRKDCGPNSCIVNGLRAKVQFRVLYRVFLRRVVDLKLLSGGDPTRLIGQFLTTFASVSILLILPALVYLFFGGGMPMTATWMYEHFLRLVYPEPFVDEKRRQRRICGYFFEKQPAKGVSRQSGVAHPPPAGAGYRARKHEFNSRRTKPYNQPKLTPKMETVRFTPQQAEEFSAP
ncbi:MAG TPA: FtsX-like permease family protein [Acidobacteriaceae bacterium]|jgi:ABC-type antimicrobial peptide transport system permease subunit